MITAVGARRWPGPRPRGSDWAGPRLVELITLLTVMTAALAVAAPTWLLLDYRPDREHPVNRLLLACQQGLQRGSLATAGLAAGLTVGVWGSVVLGRLLWRGGRDLWTMHQFRRHLNAAVTGTVVVRGVTVAVLAANDRVAFTAGLLRPRIYVSACLVGELAPDELQAVVLHERRHQQRHDPLRCWLVEVVLSSAFWLPARPLLVYYRASREVAADLTAVTSQGDDRPLLRALALADDVAVATGACGLTAERQAALRRLRHLDAEIPRTQLASMFIGVALLAGLVIFAGAGLLDWQPYWFCPGGGSMGA